MDKKLGETTNLGLEIVRQVKRKLGHVCSRLSIRIGKLYNMRQLMVFISSDRSTARSAISDQLSAMISAMLSKQGTLPFK